MNPDPESLVVRRGAGRVPWALRLSEVWDVGIVVLDPDLALEFVNDRGRTLLGCSTDRDLARCWKRLHGQVTPHLTRLPPTAEQPLELTLEVRNARARAAQLLRCQVFAIEEEHCVGYLLLLQPAEAAASIEASLRHATRNRGMTSLYRDTAHDLKGMLNVINLNVELLQRVVESEVVNEAQRATATKSAEVLRRELQRIDRFVDVLLDRRTLEQSRPAIFDARGVCQNLMELVAARCRRQRIEIVLELGEAPARVRGFPDRLHAALLNLVINALDAMPRGGVLSVGVEVGAEISISVADTGPGLDERRLREIWRLHYTTKPGGSGIGLHVAQSVARAHDGRIAYYRNDGGGARFTISLPVAAPGAR